MPAPSRFRLDRTGRASVPDGYSVVASEVEFVRLVPSGGLIQVQGASLSRWAETFCQGRRWPFEIVRSLEEDIRAWCDGLSVSQAASIVEALGPGREEISGAITPLRVLRLLFPDGPWDGRGSVEHGARWLLWLSERGVSRLVEDVRPLLAEQASNWATEAKEEAQQLYVAVSIEAARNSLRAWLGLSEDPTPTQTEFPLEVPLTWRNEARNYWRSVLVRQGADHFTNLHGRARPYVLLEIAAEETVRYLGSHAHEVTRPLLGLLTGLVPSASLQDLQRRLPPNEPGDPPESMEELHSWMIEQYMPYREWEAEWGDARAHGRIAEIGKTFSLWYLDWYGAAIWGSKGHQYLATTRARELQNDVDDKVLCWIVLDGLHLSDAGFLLSLLSGEPRLSVVSSGIAMASVPTVTEFCKPALLKGATPDVAVLPSTPELFAKAQSFTDSKDMASRIASAKVGDVFIWRVGEPDRTYHQSAERSVILANVRNVLRGTAEQILRITQAAPNHVPLRIILSTDHGRLLSSGDRFHPIAVDMQSHGRVAWSATLDPGRTIPVDQDEAGDVAQLSGVRFRLPGDCKVSLTTQSFVMNDGRTGTEHFAHGGLFPEEVITPWVVIARDLALPLVGCTLTGKAFPGAAAVIQIHIENLDGVPVAVRSIRLDLGGHSVSMPLEGEVQPLSQAEMECSLEPWPTVDQIAHGSGALKIQLPDGRSVDVSAKISIESHEVYKVDPDFDLKEL